MKITQVRNATLLVEYAGQRLLVDPMLGPKGAWFAAPTSVDNHERNPLVDLPMPVEELLDVDAVVVTHLHPDHWDDAAVELLPKKTPILVQNDDDQAAVAQAGFLDVRVLSPSLTLGPVTITRTDGTHGDEDFVARTEMFGPVSGFVLQAQGEQTVYVAGDTIWHQCVVDALREHQPEIVVLNTGEARWEHGEIIIMGAQDVLRVHDASPDSQIVAVHMEALNHCVVTRQEVRDLAASAGISPIVHVPEDGEQMRFPARD